MKEQKFSPELILNSFDKDYLSTDEIFLKFSDAISKLLQNDFEKLVFLLYRIDVNEEKLKLMIKEHPAKPENVIARMIIDRQLEKIKLRKANSDKFSGESNEERW